MVSLEKPHPLPIYRATMVEKCFNPEAPLNLNIIASPDSYEVARGVTAEVWRELNEH